MESQEDSYPSEEEEKEVRRPRRTGFYVSLFLAGVVTIGLCWAIRRFDTIMVELGIRDKLPIATNLMLLFSEFIIPWGWPVLLISMAILAFAAQKGRLDSKLRPLRNLFIVWCLLFWSMTTLMVFMPVLQLQKILAGE